MQEEQIQKDLKTVRNGAIGQLILGIVFVVVALVIIVFFRQFEAVVLAFAGVIMFVSAKTSTTLYRRAKLKLNSSDVIWGSDTGEQKPKKEGLIEKGLGETFANTSSPNWSGSILLIVISSAFIAGTFFLWKGTGLSLPVPNLTLLVFGFLFFGLGVVSLIANIGNSVLNKKEPKVKHDFLSLNAYNEATRRLNKFLSAKTKKSFKKEEPETVYCSYCGAKKSSKGAKCRHCGAKD